MAFTELLPTNAQAERVAAALESLQTLNIGGGIALDKLAGVNGGTLIGNGTSAAGSPTALTKQQVVGLLGVSNRNLLDNWDFGKPVNQRGQATYANAGYGLDRWSAQYGTVTQGSGYCTLALQNLSAFTQTIENPSRYAGMTVTLSVDAMAAGGDKGVCGIIFVNNAEAGTTAAIATTRSINTVTVTLPASISSLVVGIYGGSGGETATLYRIKLELGDVSTLANDPPADYATELAKCQRYYVKLNEYYRPVQVLADSLTFQILPPVPMRIPPTITGSVHDNWLTEITGFTISAPGWAAHNVGVFAVCVKTAHGLTDATLRVEALSAEL